ncbi:MAG: TonB-dependent receptor, partial [Candidatus Eremiobacteraeota bacterium]|nr:TonB-dependent receptor [Candidatus Eremiobacteraeota bacterium]
MRVATDSFHRMQSLTKVRRLAALAFALVMVVAQPAAASPQIQPIAWVVGSVIDEAGHPVAGATISVSQNSGPAFASGVVTSDANGKFAIAVTFEGTCRVRASAPGFAAVTIQDLKVKPPEIVSVEVRLAPAANSSLVSLGTIRVNGNQALSHASAPSVSLDPQDLAGQGIEQLSDVLSQQIALTMTRPAGGAPGLPQSAALRGPDPSETVIDIDGHQLNNSNTGDFDLSLLDPSEFQN